MKQHGAKCKNCEYALKAENEECVFCSYWNNRYGQNLKKILDKSKLQKIFIDSTYTRTICKDKAMVIENGYVLNEIILMPKDECCNNYKCNKAYSYVEHVI